MQYTSTIWMAKIESTCRLGFEASIIAIAVDVHVHAEEVIDNVM